MVYFTDALPALMYNTAANNVKTFPLMFPTALQRLEQITRKNPVRKTGVASLCAPEKCNELNYILSVCKTA